MPTVCYRYFIDGLGARVRKVTPSGETWFMYDEAGHLLGEYDSAGNAVQETVYLGDTPVAVLKGTEVFYVYADHLHAPRLIADNTGKSVWQWNSDPFGVTLVNADPDGDGVLFNYNLRFPGQYFDSETRLHYNYFRDYNPSTGRYIESDPIGLRGGINTFRYARNNPLRFVDPTGHIAVVDDVIIIGVGAAAVTACIATNCGKDIVDTASKVADAVSNAISNAWDSIYTKTPNTGDPDSVYVNPGSGQERKYGKDGKPEYDIDWDHDHGQGIPHSHNWEDGKRGVGLPVSPIPKGRKPNCP